MVKRLIFILPVLILIQPIIFSPAHAFSPAYTETTRTLTATLKFGSRDSEVKILQQFLISENFLSSGYDTGYFGNLTLGAVKKFQTNYASEVLTPAGLTNATGIVGRFTRAKINSIILAHGGSPELFAQSLALNTINSDVIRLQKFLNAHGFIISDSGPGSPGQETNFFGLKTQNALKKFQESYRAEILTPSGLTSGSGVLDAASMKEINALLLQVRVSSSTPAADTVPPTPPRYLGTIDKTANSISLSWFSSTDNVAVVGYKISRDGLIIQSMGTQTAYTDSGLSPHTTYTYEVYAFDAIGNISQPARIIAITNSLIISGVTGLPPSTSSLPSLTLSANPPTINAGDNTTLTWNAVHATQCTRTNGWSGSVGVSGSVTISLSATKTFSMTCQDSGGNVTPLITVTVNVSAVIIPSSGNVGASANTGVSSNSPTVTLTANPTSSISSGGSVALTWSGTNITSCTKSGGWSGASYPSGNQTISNLTETKTFIISCAGSSGASAQTQTTVTVVPPLSCQLGAQQIPSGGHVTAYAAASVPFDQTCTSEIRTCTNGVLSGSFSQTSCTISAPTLTTYSGLYHRFESDSGITLLDGRVQSWQVKSNRYSGNSFYTTGESNNAPLYEPYGNDTISSVKTTVEDNAELRESVLPAYAFKKDGTLTFAFWLPKNVPENVELFSMNAILDDGTYSFTQSGLSLVYRNKTIVFNSLAGGGGTVSAPVVLGTHYIATIRFGTGIPMSLRLNGFTLDTSPETDVDLYSFFGQPTAIDTFFRIGAKKDWLPNEDRSQTGNAAYQGILMYTTALSDAQIDAQEKYLAAKFEGCRSTATAPGGLSADVSNYSVKVKWPSIPCNLGVSALELWRWIGTGTEGSYSLRATLSPDTTEFLDNTAQPVFDDLKYKMRVITPSGVSDFGPELTITPPAGSR